MHSLPRVENIEAFEAWRTDLSRCLPAVLDIARTHGLPHGDPHLFPTGTNLVVALDARLVLKLFPPLLRHQFVSERSSLSQLRGRLSVPIPEIVLEGERDQWPYLVITRLNGILGTQAWPALPEDQKERVLGQIGATIAEVQHVPVGALSSIEPHWDRFTVPALITDGWNDRYKDGAIENYQASKSNVWLLLGPWQHAKYKGATEIGTLLAVGTRAADTRGRRVSAPCSPR